MTKNPIAVALGRLAKGRPKNFSRAELRRRRKRMVAMNKRSAVARELAKLRADSERRDREFALDEVIAASVGTNAISLKLPVSQRGENGGSSKLRGG